MNKGMSNIYLKITIEKNWLSRNFVSRSVFGEHQLMQISQNFKTSCCNLKIRDLGTKQCVEKFYYFNFERNYDVFKLKRPYILSTVVRWNYPKKKRVFLVPFILSKGNLLKICVLSQCIVHWIRFQNIQTFLLIFKIVGSLKSIFKKIGKHILN